MRSGDDTRFQRAVDHLFDAVLDRPAAERTAFLDAQPVDPEVRAVVDRLLAHLDDSSDGPLSSPPAGGLLSLVTGGALGGTVGDAVGRSLGLDPASSGERIGPYEVVGEIARGGMAAVYRADRVDGQFEQTVALKLALAGTHDQNGVERFHQERQILASLRHPSIAQLLDGGLTDDGRSWFAMELVDGAPIDRWCDSRRLDVRRRLRLFLDVARAVEAAHRALIVHRDLKPSNVLVAADGEIGRVKLLDFGIAKWIHEGSGAAPALTRVGRIAMTPEFASPEQLQGELVTTASDIYQLGLLLYQLLCGRPAHRITRHTPVEIVRAVLDREPEPPSVAPDRRPDPDSGDMLTAEEVGRLRRTSTHSLRRTLAGDLDTIVLKALRKEPDRRYRSAGELADDVERFLEGRPVAARGDSIVYRVSKFAGRHRLGVGVAVAASILLVGLVGFYTWRLDAERDAARAEAERAQVARVEAEAARDQSEAVSTFLTDLFERSDPWKADAEPLTARDLLARGGDRIRADLADQPLLQARMMATIGHVHRRLGDLDAAEGLFTEALAIRRRELGEADPSVAEMHHELAVSLRTRNRFDDAEPRYRLALEIREQALGADHPSVGRTLRGLGMLLTSTSRFDEAEAVLRRSVDVARAAEEPLDHALALGSLAGLLEERARYDEAETLYSRVVSMVEALQGEGDLEVAGALTNLSKVYLSTGRDAEAVPMLRRALAIKRQRLDAGHPNIASTCVNLASALSSIDPDASEALLHEAVTIFEAAYGENHVGLGNAVTNLASLAVGRGDLEVAVERFERALAIRRATLGDDHAEVGVAWFNLGQTQSDLGRDADAGRSYRRALAIFEAGLDDDHPYVAFGRYGLARSLVGRGRHGEAEPLLARALAAVESRFAPDHEARVAITELHAEVRTTLGRPAGDGS
ncbi:MAG: serine/threonine-protein kinase [Acidobacteriota bacterium]